MDNHVLVGPGGASAVNIGSWLRADPGPDYDPGAVLAADYAENPFIDGGLLAFEQSRVRRMKFPLILASGGAGLSLTGLESLLRFNARPGGYVDIQPDGVPSAEAVRFDILAGRWNPAYSIRHNEIDRRLGTLELDVQPYGYWPTWVTLASVASVGLPGQLYLPQGSRVGDAPGFARISFQGTTATQPRTDGGASAWTMDMMAWGFGHPSFVPFLSGGSFAAFNVTGSAPYAAAAAPASQSLAVFRTTGHASWVKYGRYLVPSALAPAYTGRFRAFLLAGMSPSFSVSFRALLDTITPQMSAHQAMASGNPIATVPNLQANPSAVTPPTGSYFPMLDMGVIGPGGGSNPHIDFRVWMGAPTTNITVTTAIANIGGVILIPDSGGVLYNGLAQPSINDDGGNIYIKQAMGVMIDGRSRTVQIKDFTNALDQSDVQAVSGLSWYRGQFPMIGASVGVVAFAAGARTASSGYAAATANQLVQNTPQWASVVVQYQPRFAFLKGL